MYLRGFGQTTVDATTGGATEFYGGPVNVLPNAGVDLSLSTPAAPAVPATSPTMKYALIAGAAILGYFAIFSKG